jgi:hypothetical protein
MWSSLHRVDALGLAFTLAALALATARRPWLAAACCLLAIATKQTFIVAPIAICLALWPAWSRMLRFAALVGGGLALGVGIGQWLTGGWFLWHTVVANSNESDLATFATLLGSFVQFNGLLVLAAAAACLLPARRGERVWRLYFCGCLATLPSLAKLGASSNYWLELTAATAVLIALASQRLQRTIEARIVAPLVVCGALLVAVPGYQATAVEATTTLRDRLWPTTPAYLSLVGDGGPAPYRVDSQFIQQVAREPGALLTDNPGLAVAADKPITYEFQIFQLLLAEGHWSEEPILAAIRARQFGLVALMHPLDAPIPQTRWTPAIRDALLAAYVPAGQQAGFWLYRPAGSGA